MKKIFWFFFFLLLLAVGVIVWLCTGSFKYQSSTHKEFIIDDPLSVVCQRAMNMTFEPDSEDSFLPKIDMKEAAKNCSLGQPIEVELNHPQLGRVKALVKINLEMETTSLKIRGQVVSMEPNQVVKYGKKLADVENFAFVLKISAANSTGEKSGFMRFFSSNGKTVVELSVETDVNVHFRDMEFVHTRAQQMVEESQEKMIHDFEDFLDENLRKPIEEEIVSQDEADSEPKKGLKFWDRQKDEPQAEEQPLEPEEETASQDEAGNEHEKELKYLNWLKHKSQVVEQGSESDEGADAQDDDQIDVSALDEEI